MMSASRDDGVIYFLVSYDEAFSMSVSAGRTAIDRIHDTWVDMMVSGLIDSLRAAIYAL